MTDPEQFADGDVTVYHGDCLDVLTELPDASVDAVVTDPPYGLEFMGKEWDGANGFRRSLNAADAGRDNAFGRTSRTSPEYRATPEFQAWCELWAAECLRVLKPGGHMLAFGGTRTWHRLVCAVEDAGFEIRDSIAWMYGSGFPKSLDVSKAIDKAAGAERDVVGTKLGLPGYSATQGNGDHRTYGTGLGNTSDGVKEAEVTAPATDAARRWQGWGTALKPAHEPICVARKPLIGTVAANVQEHGTGALNIDGCRIDITGTDDRAAGRRTATFGDEVTVSGGDGSGGWTAPEGKGRWPANVVLSHEPDCVQVGTGKVRGQNPQYTRAQEDERRDNRSSYVTPQRPRGVGIGHADADGTETVPVWACAPGCQVAELDEQSGDRLAGAHPASRSGRKDPTEAIGGNWSGTQGDRVPLDRGGASRFFYTAKANSNERPRIAAEGEADHRSGGGFVAHPTVKPLALMRWLVRLVTPPGGLVLDPFLGSGTTAEACVIEGFRCVGVEREADYLALIEARLTKPIPPVLF